MLSYGAKQPDATSPQLQAFKLIFDQRLIAGSDDLPKYLGCIGGDHVFRKKDGREIRVDLVLQKVAVVLAETGEE